MKTNKRLRYIYNFDQKKYKHEFASGGKLVAKLNNSPYWFMPIRLTYSSMGLAAFQKHIRKLAEHYGATEATIQILPQTNTKTYLAFKRNYLFREKHLEDTDQNKENVYYIFIQKEKYITGNKINLDIRYIHEYQAFPENKELSRHLTYSPRLKPEDSNDMDTRRPKDNLTKGISCSKI